MTGSRFIRAGKTFSDTFQQRTKKIYSWRPCRMGMKKVWTIQHLWR